MSRSYKHNPGGRNCGSGPPGYGKWVRRRDHKRFRARWRQALIYGWHDVLVHLRFLEMSLFDCEDWPRVPETQIEDFA